LKFSAKKTKNRVNFIRISNEPLDNLIHVKYIKWLLSNTLLQVGETQFFFRCTLHLVGTLLFNILLFSLLFLLKLAHLSWPFFNDIIKMLFPRFNLKIGCVNLIILILLHLVKLHYSPLSIIKDFFSRKSFKLFIPKWSQNGPKRVTCLFLQNQHKAYEKTDYLEWWIMWNDKLFYLYFSNPQNVKWDNRDMWNETID
jgi:hypothetical protein